jgi:hypothetical protein
MFSSSDFYCEPTIHVHAISHNDATNAPVFVLRSHRTHADHARETGHARLASGHPRLGLPETQPVQRAPQPCALGPVRALAERAQRRLIHILKAAEDAGKDPKKSYGVGRHIGTVEGLVQQWLASDHNRHQLMSKLTTRFHLGLSETLPGVYINPENVKIIPDISTFVLLHTGQRSPTRRDLSWGLLRDLVGGNTIRTTIRPYPRRRSASAALRVSSRSTPTTSQRAPSTARTRSS